MSSTNPLMAKVFSALVANLFQTGMALIWIGGLRRVIRPLPADLTANLLAFSLVFPAFVTVAQIIGIIDIYSEFTLIRASAWATALTDIRTTIFTVLIFFFAAIALIFLFQEVVPFWQSRRGLHSAPRVRDPRIDAALGSVQMKSRELRLPRIRAKTLRAFRLETETSVAALSGLVDPVLLVSRGLLERLSAEELEAVVAHEWAHYRYGGNFAMFFVWIFRALQAPNPAALIMFRSLVENREAACDALAAWVTKKPEALARAIVKVHEEGFSTNGDVKFDLADQAESVATRLRVEALAEQTPSAPTSFYWSWLGAAILGAMIWMIR